MSTGQDNSSKSFWATLPGILTGVAGLITASCGGLFILFQIYQAFNPPPTPTAAPFQPPPGITAPPQDNPSGAQDSVSQTQSAGQSGTQTAIAFTLAADSVSTTQTAAAQIAFEQGDDDRDGLSNADESRLGTSVSNPDSDGDGLNDGAEISLSTNPINPDSDSDGLLDGQESAKGTNPNRQDSDGDGLSDKDEIDRGTNPNASDSDNDGLNDGQELSVGTNPLILDSDGDGLSDGNEVNTLGTNPNNSDTDGDGLNDSVDSDPKVAIPQCQTKVLTAPAHNTIEYIPPRTNGDADFGGHGPKVTVNIEFRPTNIVTKSGENLNFRIEIQMTAIETQPDNTTASGSYATKDKDYVLDIPNGYVFDKFVTPLKNICQYIDSDHAVDTVYPTENGPAKYCTITGDTEGNEAGTETKVVVSFNPMQFQVKQVDGCR